MKALMKQLVRLPHYCEWGVGNDQPPPPKQLTNFCHIYSHSLLLSFCKARWCLMQGKCHSQLLETAGWHMYWRYLLRKIDNTPFPFLAERTSAHSEESQTSTTSKTSKKAIPLGSLNWCSMVFVLAPSRLKICLTTLTLSNPNLFPFTNKGCFKRSTDIFEHWARGFAS